jgi:hypothetical protein
MNGSGSATFPIPGKLLEIRKKIRLPGVLLIIAICMTSGIGCMADAKMSGTVDNPAGSQSEGTLPDIYTAPIGGFNETTIAMNPNSTYTTNYILYTRNWTGGNVTYTLYDKNGKAFVSDDQLQLSLEPSRFTAGPDQTYISHLTLTTGPKFDNHYNLLFAVDLQGNTKHYANDTLWIWQDCAPGLGGLAFDRMNVENQTITMKGGERQNVNVTFMHGWTGIEDVTYRVSDPPLNITVIPASFVASKGGKMPYPATLVISADPSISPGLYNFSLRANRTESIFFTGWGRDNEGVLELGHGYSQLDPKQYNFTVTVTEK